MKSRVFTAVFILSLLFSAALAEFYTSNPDVYYHADANCMSGSTYEISEAAARQFEKIACPVCISRASIGGEMIEIPLPEGYANFSLQDVDFRDGRLLLCGYVDQQNNRPWLAMYNLQGNKLQEALGDATHDLIRDAKFLSDGKIGLIRSIGGMDGKWHVQLFDGNKMVYKSEGARELFRIWPTDGGFFVYGRAKLHEYQLAKFDLNGKLLWTMNLDMFPLSDGQPGLMDILTGAGVHIAYGRAVQADGSHRPMVAAFDDGGKIIAQGKIDKLPGTKTKALYDSSTNPTGYTEVDSYLSYFVDAVRTDGGAIFAGGSSVSLYNSDGEVWFTDLARLWDENEELLLDGKAVEGGYVADMIEWKGGCLLAMTVDVYTPMLGSGDEPSGKGYVHMIELNPEGKIVRDWFEETADIVSDAEIRLLQDDGSLYLLVEGGTMIPMQAYEEGYPVYKVPRKMIIKRIDV